MRPLLHIISVILLLPGFFIASAFLMLFIMSGRAAIANESLLIMLLELFNRLLSDLSWLMIWGICGVAMLLIIIAGGFFIQTRWLAAFCVGILSVISTIVCILFEPTNDAWLLLSGLASLGISSWLVFEEWH